MIPKITRKALNGFRLFYAAHRRSHWKVWFNGITRFVFKKLNVRKIYKETNNVV